jgi:ankyrin repeat protein, putative
MRRFLVFFTAVIFSRFLIRIHFFIKTGNKRMVILYLLGIIISGGILISFFTSGNYDTGKKSVSNTLSIQAANKNTLNAFNYLTVQPDFVFQKMNRHCMGLTSQYAEIANTFQCNKDFYGITGELYTIGNRQKTKDKYLGKIIKTPFMAWAYSNSGNTVYLSDEGYVEEGLATRDYVYCRLVDEENIKKYADESKLNRGTFDVIGVLSSIDTYEGILVLDPCFYIKKHNSNSSSSSKSSYNTPQISSNLTLDISKPVYEKNENIALLAQWIGPDVDCKILEEKVKETLVSRHFEIVDGSLSCAGNDNKSLIQLRVQFKSPRIGKLNIPSIKLDNVNGNSVDFSVRDLETLQNAVVSKNVESIKAFLSSPSDLDEIKIDGEHPVAHFIKDDMTFAQELIKLGASADVIDKNGYTPLMYAVIRQDNNFLNLLLNKKVYLNEVDKKGRTAIMYAAIKNNLYAAKKLIEHRTDIYKSKDEKWTAYKYAKEMKHDEIAELLKGNKDRIVLVIDNCDVCKAKEKIFLKLTKNYPSLPRSDILTITPNNDKKSKEHYWDKKFPLVKFGDGKTLDSDVMSAFRPGHRLDNWDGTEKQLETIMYKD